jgi:hypothetical protein
MSAILKKKDYPDNYSADVLDVIKTMSFTDGKDINIIGSMSLRSQLYAGDYDMNETVAVSYKTDAEALKHFANGFKEIVRDLLHKKDCYIGDIKSGVVPEWNILDDIYNYKNAMYRLKKLKDDGIVNENEFEEARGVLKEKPTVGELAYIKKAIKFHIIRWTPKDVLRGFCKLRDGREYSLEEAFSSPSITKLDVVALVQNSRFTDFSCLYTFKNKRKVLNNVKMDSVKEIKENLMYYLQEGNYFKVAKRMFSLAKLKNDTKTIEKLNELLNSDLGRLYSLVSDANTILYLLENEKDIPFKKIKYEVNQFRNRIANIYSIGAFDRKEPTILETILAIERLPTTTEGRNKMRRQMEKLIGFFEAVMDKYSQVSLENIGLYPIPKQYQL